jgi:precorrin-6B methylase 1
MEATQVDVVERTTELLTRFSLSTAAPELAQRLETAGHREALLLVVEDLEMEDEVRATQNRSSAPRCPASAR